MYPASSRRIDKTRYDDIYILGDSIRGKYLAHGSQLGSKRSTRAAGRGRGKETEHRTSTPWERLTFARGRLATLDVLL